MDRCRPELWGGPECTLNRVGNLFFDQFARSGHVHRPGDLELFAELGITAIRYPVLWERTAPERPDLCEWDWTDSRLHRLRELGVGVIAGLVHHGGGPAYTNLLDDRGFAQGLAEHARRVAERYPWIDRWIPVNEPLTTARFSALYGHWYPHARDEESFWRALLNQIDGVRLAMAAIREVNPDAQLIQTDDLGRTFATGAVCDQAAFDNVRRWAGWDLLCGRVSPQHPLWTQIAAFGLEARLEAIVAAPCPPDIIGVNHYLTSDRFLDHRTSRYPPHVRGGNGRHSYADVEAVRVLDPAPPGLEGALREAWERYRIPVAVTEVHNGCTREEQMRWMAEAWDCAQRLHAEGVEVRAVTIWSLLGSCGWNTLLTGAGCYEPGVFDVSREPPRATALAPLMRGLPHGARRPDVACAAPWWRRPVRLEHPVVRRPAPLAAHRDARSRAEAPPLLILGATGRLGRAFARACELRNLPHVPTARAEIDVRDEAGIGRALDRHKPWAVVNATGWAGIDDAEDAPEPCYETNVRGPARLARAAAERGIPTLHVSSDLVFDGRSPRPYVESDAPSPIGVYGASKALMEDALLALDGRHLVVRTAAFFSPCDPDDFAVAAATALGGGTRFRAAADLVVSPTYVPHLVAAALDLLIDGETGIWHLTHGSAHSWADFARLIAGRLGLSPALVEDVAADELGFRARRPRYAALATERGAALPPLEVAVSEFASGFSLQTAAAAAQGARVAAESIGRQPGKAA